MGSLECARAETDSWPRVDIAQRIPRVYQGEWARGGEALAPTPPRAIGVGLPSHRPILFDQHVKIRGFDRVGKVGHSLVSHASMRYTYTTKARWTLSVKTQTSRANPVQCCSTHQEKHPCDTHCCSLSLSVNVQYQLYPQGIDDHRMVPSPTERISDSKRKYISWASVEKG